MIFLGCTLPRYTAVQDAMVGERDTDQGGENWGEGRGVEYLVLHWGGGRQVRDRGEELTGQEVVRCIEQEDREGEGQLRFTNTEI